MTSGSARIRLRAPAKVNLGLRLVGRRPDGYHLLESIFAPLALADELEIEMRASPERADAGAAGARCLEMLDLAVVPAEGSRLPAALSGVSAGPDNLVVRAAVAFCEAVGLVAPLRIRLRKAIPAGAGLGGGSSDAAAMLLGLRSLFDAKLDAASLRALGLGLGADVPFFLEGQLAHVAGIGEQISPLEPLPEVWLVLANPGISLATVEVYRVADVLGSALTDPGAGSTMRAFSRLREEWHDPGETPERGLRADSQRANWQHLLVNDLAPAARRLCPPVGRLLDRISGTHALGASLSGSGATVFSVYATRHDAEEAVRILGSTEADAAWVELTRLAGPDEARLGEPVERPVEDAGRGAGSERERIESESRQEYD